MRKYKTRKQELYFDEVIRLHYEKGYGEDRISSILPVGRNRFEDIVDKYGLKVRRRVRKPKTTDSTHGLPVYPYLIKDFIPF